MKLIIGLGNPEPRYDGTRHNARVLAARPVCPAIAELAFQPKAKFKASVAEFDAAGDKVIMAKPTTYYNLSGEAVRALADFYKVPVGDILVVHDEIALPCGTIRTRRGGSDAGNNGVRSVTEHLGDGTARLRIGTHNDLREQIEDADFVLSKFTADETSPTHRAASDPH
jgi:PTH1 family peptidyl-tRNA hydrolase